jgi:hypothetical protein
MFSSTRYPGSAKELSNVPNFSEDDPQYVPPDSWFLLHRVCLVIGLYYLNTFCLDIQLRSNKALLAEFISRSSQKSLMFHLRKSSHGFRYQSPTESYSIATFKLFYLFFALIGVAMKPAELRFWWRLFGSIETSCTMRRFWG